MKSHLEGVRQGIRRRARSRAMPRGAEGTDQRPASPTRITVFAYRPDEVLEQTVETAAELVPLLDAWPALWVDVDGYGAREELERIAEVVGLHPLALEDALVGSQRSKAEAYPEHHFFVTRMLSLGERVDTEQVNLFLNDQVLVTLQSGVPGDCLEPVREALRIGRGLARARGPDYLLYLLVDAIVDHCFPVLEAFGERLETLEREVVTNVATGHASRIQAYKHDLFAIRRTLWPMRDAVASLHKDPSPHIKGETHLYFRDVHDHANQLLDIVDTYREVAAGLMDIHLAAMNNRMGEVIKVLTVISTVFIPLTFIAGVYGMNFDTARSPWNMPELEWYWGYPFAIALMVVTALGMVAYFRNQRWLG